MARAPDLLTGLVGEPDEGFLAADADNSRNRGLPAYPPVPSLPAYTLTRTCRASRFLPFFPIIIDACSLSILIPSFLLLAEEDGPPRRHIPMPSIIALGRTRSTFASKSSAGERIARRLPANDRGGPRREYGRRMRTLPFLKMLPSQRFQDLHVEAVPLEGRAPRPRRRWPPSRTAPFEFIDHIFAPKRGFLITSFYPWKSP